MDKRLKYTIILGYLFLIAFIILLNVHSGSVKILGYEAFKLGNKTVMLKELSGTRLLSESDSRRSSFSFCCPGTDDGVLVGSGRCGRPGGFLPS